MSFNSALKEGVRSWDIHQEARNAILGVSQEQVNDRWYVDIKNDANAIYKYHSIKRETIE